MARISGIDLPNEKRIDIALTYIYGVGLVTAKKILSMTGVDPSVRVRDLNDNQIKVLTNAIDKNVTVEGELRQMIRKNITRLKDIKCYRGLRHRLGLPVRGQRTRTNALTSKGGKNIAVGGLNPKITKT